MPKSDNFLNFISKYKASEKVDKENLAVIYRYLGDKNIAAELFDYLSTLNLPDSRYGKLPDEMKNDVRLLEQLGHLHLVRGINFCLAGKDPQRAGQFFTWAAENCSLPQEFVELQFRSRNFDDIAIGHLWRGYALLALGKIPDACDLLKQVAPLFNQHKQSGGDIWQKVEYALPKALVPLCEYLSDPSEGGKQKANSGLEEFIQSLNDNKDKLNGYLYYFHLKEVFRDVYSETGASQLGGLSETVT